MSSDESGIGRRGFLCAAVGATAATGAVGTATAQEETESGDDYPGSGQTEEVVVGPGGSLVFEAENLQILQGTTVDFVWDSNGHNIVVESQPEGANWEGTEGGAGDLYDEGHEYSHTFETLGTYEYFCAPHKGAGMVGNIEVVEEISTPAPASGPPEIPDSAKTLGIAATIGMGSTLGLAYFLMRFGGDYDD
ncbi:halocyanin [Halobacteriales archaeon QH_7_66_36]|nr:MAG: halocyanin [Halobacteriales archaeon QH_7_66_36]